MGALPVLRFELEGVRHSLLHALADQAEDIQKAVDVELTRFIDGFDFGACVRAQMRPVLERCIANAIQTHFQYGPGREVIEAEVAKVLAPGEGKIS